MTSRYHLTRKGFLKIATNFMFGLSGLLGLGGLVRFFSYQLDPGMPTEFDLGQAANYPDGSRTIRTDIPAVIYNRSGEYTAYSLSCTHLGCTVELDRNTSEVNQGFTCPCHGSRYDAQGKVLKGPAQKPLRKLRVELQADNTLKLYTNRGQP